MALVQKAFSDIITFSRSSNATRVGPTGLVEYAPHNLLTYSEDISNASWTKNEASVIANAATAPDGTVTADMLIPTASAGIAPAAYQGVTVGLVTYTWSVYAKAAGYTWLMLKAQDVTAGTCPTWFNLSTGVIGSTTSGNINTITSVGNGWYRCTITRVVSNASAFMNIPVANADNVSTMTGDGTSGIYIWGAQLSVGPYALDYTPTTSAAVYGPRFDYDPSGVTIVDPVSRNLLTYSEQFDNAAWGKTTVTVAANSIASPDGTITADLVTATAGGGGATVLSSGITVTASTAYTYSVFIKAGTATSIQLRLTDNVTGQALITANLLTGATTVSAGPYGSVTASSVEYANGWRRFIVTGTQPSGQTSASVGVYLLNNADTVYLWGAQLEAGSTATSYMVSGATNGFRAVPVTSGTATARGLLVEEQRTNLLTYSDDFSNAAWDKGSGFTLTPNAIASPDGTINADLFVRGSTLSFAWLSQSFSGNANQALTFSCWVRTVSGSSSIALVISDVNLASVGSSSLSINTTWQRLSFSITAGQLSNTGVIGVGFTMSSGQSAYFWGAQLEAGSFATSYIPTLASTVTRSADLASVDTLTPWMNQTEGTIFAEYLFYGADAAYNNTVLMLTDGTENNYETIFGHNPAYGWVQSGGATSAGMSSGGSTAINTNYKAALAFKANDFAFSLNGGAAVTDTSGTVPTVTQMLLGRRVSASKPLHGYLRRVAFFPRRLSNAELQALTA